MGDTEDTEAKQAPGNTVQVYCSCWGTNVTYKYEDLKKKKNISGTPPDPRNMVFLDRQEEYFEVLS